VGIPVGVCGDERDALDPRNPEVERIRRLQKRKTVVRSGSIAVHQGRKKKKVDVGVSRGN